jgi:hypothetical protein
VTLAGQDYLTLSTQQITANKIALDDLANGTDGELITWDAAGAPAAVAVGTSGQVLTSNGAGAAPTFQDSAGGGGDNIRGLELDYNSGTLKCLQGEAVVDGSTLTIGSGGTTTISGDAVTSKNALFYIYLYDNASTVQMHREERVSGSDDPVWDYDLNYAKHPVDGASKRCIGAVWYGQTTAGVLDNFVFSSRGRVRTYWPDKYVQRLVSGGSATTPTSVAAAAYAPAASICKRVGMKIHVQNASAGAGALVRGQIGVTSQQMTDQSGLQVSAQMDNASPAAALGPMLIDCDADQTYYYFTNSASNNVYIDMYQWEMYV